LFTQILRKLCDQGLLHLGCECINIRGRDRLLAIEEEDALKAAGWSCLRASFGAAQYFGRNGCFSDIECLRGWLGCDREHLVDDMRLRSHIDSDRRGEDNLSSDREHSSDNDQYDDHKDGCDSQQRTAALFAGTR